MIEFPELFEQAFEQYGLVGLVVAFLILGPGFTYLRTRNASVQAEMKAQTLLNRFAQDEHIQAERMEERLNAALVKLEDARQQVLDLRIELLKAQHDLTEMAKLREQVQTLSRQVCDLEGQIEAGRIENERLRESLRQKGERILGLERALAVSNAKEMEAAEEESDK